MYIAIDIGAYKTTIYSTEDGGSVVVDEFGKREFSTVLALTTPVRSFGKAVSGDSPQHMLLRRRYFFHDIKSPEAQKYVFMYFNYLDRLLQGKYDSAVLVVPEYFGEEEKTIIRVLACASKLRVGGVLTHLTGVASSAVLRNLNHPEVFAIFDFGFHKSAAGLFEFKDNRLVPLKRAYVKRGAADFDNIIYSILMKKYNLRDDVVTRERLFQVVGSIKRGLNQLESVFASIFDDNYENIKLELTQSEFFAEAEPVMKDIASFVKGFMSEIGSCTHVQVVGNNYNSKIIQDIMKEYPHATILHPSESAALGACLAFGVNERKTKYCVEEACGSEYSVVVLNPASANSGENKSKPTVIFEKDSLRNNMVSISYTRKGPFSVEIYENGQPIGYVHVQKEETENAEKIKLKFRIDSFGMLEVCGAFIQPKDRSEDPKVVETRFERRYGVPAEHLNAIEMLEEEYYKQENDFKKAGEARHATETYVDTFVSVIDKNFPGLLTSEDRNKIDDIADGVFNKSGGSLEEEIALRNNLFKELDFVAKKLAKEQTVLENQLKELLKRLEPYVEECKNSGDYEMHRLKISVSSFLSSLNLSLESFVHFDRSALDKLVSSVETSIAMKEFIKKTKSETSESKPCESSCGCKHSAKEPSNVDAQETCCSGQDACCKNTESCDCVKEKEANGGSYAEAERTEG